MKAVLERPYGCAEQTISSAYPSLLYLELAKAVVWMRTIPCGRAQTYLQLGYDRLKITSTPVEADLLGGRDHDADPALTAYAIEFLNEASGYIPVDHSEIRGALEWLLKNQKADGAGSAVRRDEREA